ncbi:enhanced filamentous growth protein, putative [Candida dubliniensis CD36]|uniref:Enhanced filamentous growth protein, putative n=1 Tax=Candida dubliniensis (strain CD36 / ATCC MYA-646 / CBS 7987 / NCPF 3949 / NRRL Y-17841) TaxID=573826 RepID=B9WMI5_CANDC|nr:enhanced filamentous growth protein, putative [Candida dubliniensis CD36]CAX40298.1 enhanced filamentous growth protein, putative [Candida dubliniensis CD36]
MSTYSIPYYNQMNGNNYNGMPQQTTAANQQAFSQQQPTATGNTSQQQQQQSAAVAAAAAAQQPYNYMFYQQQGQPGQQTTGQQQYDYSAYNRYSYPAATSQPNYYQQTIPNQLSQPQPQHYNGSNRNYTSAPSGAPIPSNSTSGPSQQPPLPGQQAVPIPPHVSTMQQPTPVQDTLNTSNTSTVGQFQPPGIRPRVTTTMWEDEKTLCYQVDANNVSVVRRADNNMINGTKLLNVAQMTRGRRDGILKSEKVRHVVKIGSMHLKGVWIPFERALVMAQREGIVDMLYPLFVRDIKRVIQTGVTPNAAAAAAAATAAAASTSAPPPPPAGTATAGTPKITGGNRNSISATNGGSSASGASGAGSTTSPVNTKAATTGTPQGNYYQAYNQQQQQYPQQYGQYNAPGKNQNTPGSQQGSATSTNDSYLQQAQAQQQQVYGYQSNFYPNAAPAGGNYYSNYYQQQQPNYASSYPYQQQSSQQKQQPNQQQQSDQQQTVASSTPSGGTGTRSVHQSPQVQGSVHPSPQQHQTNQSALQSTTTHAKEEKQ